MVEIFVNETPQYLIDFQGKAAVWMCQTVAFLGSIINF